MALSSILMIFATFATVFVCGYCLEIAALDKLHNESTSCTSSCLKASVSDMNACSRGCRLFSLCEWMTANFNEARDECKAGCQESYMKEESNAACYEGCDAALPIAQKRHAQMKMEESHIQFAHHSPLSFFFGDANNDRPNMNSDLHFDNSLSPRYTNINQDMDSALQSFFQMSSIMSFLYGQQMMDANDGTNEAVIIIEVARPAINTPHPYDKKVLPNTDSGGAKTTLIDMESNLQTNINSRRSFAELDFAAQYYADKQNDCDSYWRSAMNKAKNWWDCFTRKAGLPELVLLIFWISIMLILLMTFFSQFHTKPNKLSINGDLAFITDMKGELPSYIKAYPHHNMEKKSLYYMASVVTPSQEKVPLLD